MSSLVSVVTDGNRSWVITENLQEEGVKGSLDLFVFTWLVEQMIISSTKLETRGGLLRAGSVGIDGV